MAYSGEYPVYLLEYDPVQFQVGVYFEQDPIENKSRADWIDARINFGQTQKNKTFILNGSFSAAGTGLTFNNEEETANFNGSLHLAGYVNEILISHDSNGNANVTLSIDLTLTRKDDPSISYTIQASGTKAIHQIDRVAPEVYASVDVLSDSSIKISATSNETCKDWEYKLDSLAWVNFESGSATEAECTVTALSAARHTVQVRAKRVYNEVVGTSTTISIETTLPTVTARLSNPTYNSLDLTASATAACDLWEYSLTNGAGWTTFSTTSGTSASTTLTSLQSNTEYTVLVRARKVSNGLKGVSSAATGTTDGGAILQSVYSSAVDVASPTVQIVATIKELLYQNIMFYAADGTTLITTYYAGLLAVGTSQTYTLNLTSEHRTALLNAFPNAKNYTFKVVIETRAESSSGTIIGTSGPKDFKATTSASVSKPKFTKFTYSDRDSETTEITGDNQVLIQAASNLRVVASAGTAKNGATISGYSASIGDVSISGTSRTINVGAVSSSGQLTLRVTCTDSRGYSTSVDKTVTVLPYSKPRFTMFNLRRRNEIEDLVQLYFNGAISSITVDNTEKNSVVSVLFMWKLTSADDSAYVTVDLTNAAEMTINGLTFSYSNSQLMTLDEMNSYDFVFYVYDELGNTTVFIYHTILNQGTPLLSFRKKTNSLPPRIGLNNPEPVYDLDVHGDIAMHDVLVMGYVAGLGTDYLTEAAYRKGGIYVQTDTTKATTTKGYPVAGKAGILEVLADPDGYAVQRYTTFEAAVYIRAYNGTTWTSWKTISMS